MPMSSPVTATYLPPLETAKVVNILDLCRRLIAEWQYHDNQILMHLLKHEKFPGPAGSGPGPAQTSTDASADDEDDGYSFPATEVAQRKVEETFSKLTFTIPLTPAQKSALIGSFMKKIVSVTRIRMGDYALTSSKILQLQDVRQTPLVTVKDFRNLGSDEITDKELHKIYWGIRMQLSCDTLNGVVGEMAKQLKKQGYQGFLLPDGNMVTFDSLNFALVEFVPKKLTLLQFEMEGPSMPSNRIVTHIAGAECPQRVDMDGSLYCQHVALCFKLPSETPESPAKILVVDATSTQFGIFGAKGELVYWSYMEDYLEIFQSEQVAEEVNVYGFEPWGYKDDIYSRIGPPMAKMVLQNFGRSICGYCGEVDGRKQVKEGVVDIIVLKNCSRCKKVAYCDGICQTFGWMKHKAECKKIR